VAETATGPANRLEEANRIIGAARDLGLAHQIAEDEFFTGRTFQLAGRDLIHFGSCSYLGLELDPRLIDAGIDALRRYGAHFSSSRSYISCPLYRDLEERLERLFARPVLVTGTTTLAHLAALPILCAPGDAVLIDQQAHASLQLAANQLRALGVRVEVAAHNHAERLRRQVAGLRDRARHIWYVGDGIYSMYGDRAPLETLLELTRSNEQFHVYLDDAHGISWSGKCGKGFVLDRAPDEERWVVAVTLGKAFGAGGAALVLPNRAWQRRIQHCGGTVVFTGPVPPAMLGAAIASADIHLSGEIEMLQAQLRDRIERCNRALRDAEVPLVSHEATPVRFIATGEPGVTQAVLSRAIDRGFFLNPAVYPAVSRRRSGLRFTLTLHQREEDIDALVACLAEELPLALADAGSSVKDLRRRFHLEASATVTSRAA
jgi:7-keto-8-aminopelargonate synthetase-like enzyme